MSSKSILVVAAHPDDEVLGCGGTIAKHVFEGDRVFVIIAAEGITSRLHSDESVIPEELAHLRDSSELASSILGVSQNFYLDFPDNRLDSINRLDIVRSIESIVYETNPSVVYVHHGGDVNIDHQVLFHSVITAVRPLPSSGVRQILTFETLSSTEWQAPFPNLAFIPNWFVDIEPFFETKVNALSAYSTELRPWPHPRSQRGIATLASLRGSQVGLNRAEAFQLIRHIT
jgi:N-acetylglucosamine malate deacetylase 1